MEKILLALIFAIVFIQATRGLESFWHVIFYAVVTLGIGAMALGIAHVLARLIGI